jgi:hypothetical protein
MPPAPLTPEISAPSPQPAIFSGLSAAQLTRALSLARIDAVADLYHRTQAALSASAPKP